MNRTEIEKRINRKKAKKYGGEGIDNNNEIQNRPIQEIGHKFGKSNDFEVEQLFREQTIGLIDSHDFKRKKLIANNSVQINSNIQDIHPNIENETEDKIIQLLPYKRKICEKPEKGKVQLSFLDEQEEEEIKIEVKKLGKDPNVETYFLPDREREKEEDKLKERFKIKFLKKEEESKQEECILSYMYFDGMNNLRNSIKVKKGTLIEDFLYRTKELLQKDIKILKEISVGNLLFVKENMIIPHEYTIYDLLMGEAKGSSGNCLFDFVECKVAYKDGRMQDDCVDHGPIIKIVAQFQFEKMKTCFPYNKWIVYSSP